MKIVSIILCSFLMTMTFGFAEQVIEPTPLSVEDTGPGLRKAPTPIVLHAEEMAVPKAEEIEDLAKVKSSPIKVPANNSQDGQLKFDDSPRVTVEPQVQESVEVQAAPAEETKMEFKKFRSMKRYFQFTVGYINSRYEKFHSAEGNGSEFTGLRMLGDFTPHIQAGFGLEILNDTSEQKFPNNFRALQYRFLTEYHAPLCKDHPQLEWIAGLHLSVGHYNIQRHFLDTQGQRLAQEIKKGRLFGIIPTAGARWHFKGKNSLDLMAEYHQYIGKYQSYIGGLAIAPRLNIEF